MVDPRMLTDPIEPPYAKGDGLVRRIAAEAWDHLWPWSRSGFARQRALQAAGLALALA
ncbi:MAG TPA: transcription regulator, partial [Rhodocyclaceae bacterium]|nr:transcription regulator [Rhodocyclaceae bacterium]